MRVVQGWGRAVAVSRQEGAPARVRAAYDIVRACIVLSTYCITVFCLLVTVGCLHRLLPLSLRCSASSSRGSGSTCEAVSGQRSGRHQWGTRRGGGSGCSK